MSDRVVIVGASRGIGLALAKRLIEKGYEVTCIARHPCPDKRVRSLCADMADCAMRNEVAEAVRNSDVPLYALVYCAGTSMCAPAETTAEEDMRYLWEVNYFGLVHMVQLLLPSLRLAKGRIVGISSMAAVTPIPFDAHYDASKSAMVAYLAALRAELTPHGVQTTAVLPGGVQTDFTFVRKTYPATDCGPYAHACRNAGATLERIEQTGLTAQTVANKVAALFGCPHCPLVMPVGVGNVALYGLSKKLPPWVQNKLIVSLYSTDRTDTSATDTP